MYVDCTRIHVMQFQPYRHNVMHMCAFTSKMQAYAAHNAADTCIYACVDLCPVAAHAHKIMQSC